MKDTIILPRYLTEELTEALSIKTGEKIEIVRKVYGAISAIDPAIKLQNVKVFMCNGAEFDFTNAHVEKHDGWVTIYQQGRNDHIFGVFQADKVSGWVYS